MAKGLTREQPSCSSEGLSWKCYLKAGLPKFVPTCRKVNNPSEGRYPDTFRNVKICHVLETTFWGRDVPRQLVATYRTPYVHLMNQHSSGDCRDIWIARDNSV